MRTIITAKERLLASLSNDEVLALANVVNELLNNSTVDEHDCTARIGIDLQQLKNLHKELIAAVESPKVDSLEVFEAWRDGESLQLLAISVYGDPADLALDEFKATIDPLLEL